MATDHLGKLNAYHTKEACTAANMVRIQQMCELKNLKHFAKVVFSQSDLKRSLVRWIVGDILRAIRTMENLLRLDEHFESLTGEYQIFEWSDVHFEQSTTQEKTQYINLLLRKQPRSLYLVKFETDLLNLDKILRLLCEERLAEAMQHMRNCIATSTIRSEPLKQYKNNVNKLELVTQKSNRFDAYERRQSQKIEKEENDALEHYADYIAVYQPIYQRYQLNYIQTHYEFAELGDKLAKQKKLDEIDAWIEKIYRDRNASSSAIGHFYGEAEDYKQKIVYWSHKYDVEYEAICSKTYELKQKVQSFRQHWDEYIAKKAMFRQEIDKVKKQAAEAAEAAKVAAAAEAAALEKANKKRRRHPKGKKQAKGTKKSVRKLK